MYVCMYVCMYECMHVCMCMFRAFRHYVTPVFLNVQVTEFMSVLRLNTNLTIHQADFFLRRPQAPETERRHRLGGQPEVCYC